MPVINGVLVAIPAPHDYVVDFDHPKRQSVTASYTISGVGMIISTVFMLQRLYVKRYLRNTLGLDDCKFSLVFGLIGNISFSLQCDLQPLTSP